MASKWLYNYLYKNALQNAHKVRKLFFNENLYGVAVGKTMVPGLSKFVLVMKKIPHVVGFIRER